MKTKLIVFRHGETDWNREKKWQGASDIPLNATGIAQAQNLAAALAEHPLDFMYSSDLSRAVNTAKEVVAQQKCQLEIDSRLREIHVGEAEGWNREEVASRIHADAVEKFFSNDHLDFGFPGGETKRAHLVRLQAALTDIAAKHPGQAIGLSSHGGSLHRVYCAYWHKELELIRIPNCAFMILEACKGKFEVVENPEGGAFFQGGG